MKRAVRWLIAQLVIGIGFMLLGDARDPWLWAYYMAFAAVSGYALASIDDDLARERFSPPTAGADRLSLRAVRLIALAHLVTGLLDSRFGWSNLAPSLRATGLAGFTLAFLAIVRAMRANRFFSAVVRVQSDRGHRVVDSGPYSRLRHPGYAGMIVAVPMSGLALGSWWATAIALVYAALVLRRVVFEDRFLQQNLEGYRAYTQRVRYRLVPGVW